MCDQRCIISKNPYFIIHGACGSFVIITNDTVYLIYFSKVKLAEQSYCLHDKTVKCIDVHPLNQSLFLTASNDG